MVPENVKATLHNKGSLPIFTTVEDARRWSRRRCVNRCITLSTKGDCVVQHDRAARGTEGTAVQIKGAAAQAAVPLELVLQKLLTPQVPVATLLAEAPLLATLISEYLRAKEKDGV